MRAVVVAVVLSTGLLAAGGAPATAASTRAEYIAHVDPICQSFVGPTKNARGAYFRNLKGIIRADSSGNTKRFLKDTKKTARSLNRLAQVHASMTDQIAAVPPPDADAGTVGTWLNYRRRAEGFERSAASAFNQLRIGQASRQLRRVDKAYLAGTRAISGFGFQVCGTFPVE